MNWTCKKCHETGTADEALSIERCTKCGKKSLMWDMSDPIAFWNSVPCEKVKKIYQAALNLRTLAVLCAGGLIAFAIWSIVGIDYQKISVSCLLVIAIVYEIVLYCLDNPQKKWTQIFLLVLASLGFIGSIFSFSIISIIFYGIVIVSAQKKELFGPNAMNYSQMSYILKQRKKGAILEQSEIENRSIRKITLYSIFVFLGYCSIVPIFIVILIR